MRTRLDASTWSIVLRPWYEASLTMATQPTAITIGASQLRMLLANDFQAASSLRALVDEIGESSTALELDKEDLAEHVASLIVRGRIHVQLELREVMLTTAELPGLEPQPHPFEPSGIDEQEHWIEIEVVGPDAVVISGLRCEVTLPNGRKLIRSTDRFGLIRIDGIESAGDCTIRFPELELDESA